MAAFLVSSGAFWVGPEIAASDFDGYVGAVVAQGVAYAAAVWIVITWRGGMAVLPILILGTAILIRLIAFAAPHDGLTTDAYRYVWDARIQLAGFNPYAFVPAAPDLASLRDGDIYPLINQKERAVTIYPPIAQVVFTLGGLISDSVFGQKLVAALCELATLALVLIWLRDLGLPRERVVIYAWHPLPVWEVVSQAHIDGAATLFLMAAVVAVTRGRQSAGAALLALGAMTKVFPLVLVPALWRRFAWRPVVAFAAVCCAAALPYWLWGFPDLSGYLGTHLDMQGYGAGWGFHVVWMLRDFDLGDMSGRMYAAIAMAVLGALALFMLFARGADEVRPVSLVWLAAAFVWLTSPHYPWYFVFIVPLLAAHLSLPVAAMTVLAPVLYVTRPPGGPTWTELYAVVYWLPAALALVALAIYIFTRESSPPRGAQ
ncbi:MAG: glycosyltransferase 87 family protein [Pseudomonadota bacterium]